MSSRGGGGARGGGRGRRGGRGGDFSAEPPPAEPFYVQHGGGRGGGGRDRRGGRGGDFSAEPPPAEPFYVQHGGGRGGGGRGRRGGRGDDLSAEPYPAEPFYVQHVGGRGGRGARGGDGSGRGAATPVPPSSSVPQQPPAPPAPVAQLAEDMKKMAIKQSTPGEASTSAATPSMVPKAAAKEVAPADPEPVAPPASSKAIRHPPRPGFGRMGQKCVVRANHFLVEVANRDLCHYDVAITPESTSRARNRSIISELVKLHKQSTLSNRIPAFDGRKSLYTAGALPFTSKEFVVKLADTDTDGKSRREKEFKVTIKLASKPDLQHLQQFLRGKQLDVPQETIQALDVVMRESASTMHAVVARSFFSPEFGNSCYIGDGVECWRGYYQSLRPTQMGLSLNLDIAATSFYKAGPLVDFVFEYLNIRDPRRPLSDKDRIKLKRVLRGIRVEATHRRERCFRYKITGLSSVPMNQLKFPLDDQGEMVSVVQYFKQRYNCSLEYVSWPCLQAGNDSRPTYLPIEVCNLLEGQRYARKLNERQVTGILRATCQRPADRERSISEMVKRNNYNNDNYVKEFGIWVASQLVSVDARVLPPPKLKYHDSGREKICCPSVGQWNMINKKMVDGGKVQNWTCLSFSSRIRRDEVVQFCNDLVRMCNSIGMEFNPRPFIDIQTVRPDDIENALKKVHTQSDEGRQLQLLLVILPDMSGLYGRIKTVCETGLTGLGIVSQCCLPKNINKGKQYLENVALKINVKVGGRNTVLEAALHGGIPFLTEMPTIIFGADVTHPAPGDDSLSSIAAVVGSMDWPEVTKYRGLVSAQQHRQEIISDLFSITQDPKKGIVYGGMIRELLISFLRATKRKPARIIFYRDGVSEGQFNQVLLSEMDAIRRACASLEEGYLPPVTFVVVQKRHHTRLFPEVHGKRELTDRSGNILAGTVVDTKICHPTEFDFYLCSHAGIQGTSRPTHYHVLYDENHFTADGLQMLTNNLCYTYARCTRSVSIVPPAYYAHLVAFRARYYMEDNSEAASSAGGGHQRDFPVEVRRLPKISNNVKDVMFYC